MGVQLCLYHPPGCEGEHPHQGTQGHPRASLDGPVQDPAVRPCSAAEIPDGSPLGTNLLDLDLPSDLPGSDVRRRVAIERCKPYTNHHGSGDMPKFLTGGADAVRAQQFFQEVSTVRRHSGRRLDAPPTVGGRADHRSSVGTGARWRKRGAIQDALGGTLRTLQGAGNGPPPLPPTHLGVTGPEPRTSTANPTASTAECQPGRHSACSPATTGNVS